MFISDCAGTSTYKRNKKALVFYFVWTRYLSINECCLESCVLMVHGTTPGGGQTPGVLGVLAENGLLRVNVNVNIMTNNELHVHVRHVRTPCTSTIWELTLKPNTF